MKTFLRIFFLSTLLFLLIGKAEKASAQFVIGDIVKLTVTKVIKAIDLKVQRLQNKTIWLQNAQKTLENELSEIRLSEISTWSSDQKNLFSNYYDELWKIKATIACYKRVKDVAARQAALVSDYHRNWNLLRQDQHFSVSELHQMSLVYSGILTESEHNLDEVINAVSAGKTQMTDEQRLELVNRAADRMEENYSDLRQFNRENQVLSLQRSHELGNTKTTQQLYGLQ